MDGKDLIIAVGGVNDRYLASMVAQKQVQEDALRHRRREQEKKRRKAILRIVQAAVPIAAVFILVFIIYAVNILNDRHPAVLTPLETETESCSEDTASDAYEKAPDSEEGTEEQRDDARTALTQYLESLERVSPGDYQVSMSHDGATVAKRCSSTLPGGIIGGMTEDLDSDGKAELLLISLEKTETERETYDGGHSTTSLYIPVFSICEWIDGEVRQTARLSLTEAEDIRTEWSAGYPIYNLWSLGNMTADFFTYRDQGKLLLVFDMHKTEDMFADGSDDAFLCLEFADDGEGCTFKVRGSGAMSNGYDENEYLQELRKLGIDAENGTVRLREVLPDVWPISGMAYVTVITQEDKAAFDKAAGSETAVIPGQYRLETE